MTNRLILSAAVLAFVPLSAAAATTSTGPDTSTLATNQIDDDDGDDIPWGLLGVVGLAGLLGRKRDNHQTHTPNRS